MPKSAAERQRDRRSRLKSDAEALELYRERDRLRKQAERARMTDDELKTLRNKTMLNTRAWRERNLDNTNTETPPESDTPYSCPQTFGRAKRKAERSLPVSPHKRLAVIKGLASRYLSVKFTTPRSTGIDVRTKTAVSEYYESDSISRMAPGKADVIIVRDDNGFKVKKQKRHMSMTISEAFQLFIADHPECKVGKSSFASLRPKCVLLSSQMPHNVCGCKYHNNIILLLESLHRKCPSIPLYSKAAFLPLCVCDTESEACMSSNCDVCSDGKLFDVNFTDGFDDRSDNFVWYQWQTDTDGYLVKGQVKGTVDDAIRNVRNQLPRFLWHAFIKGKQSQSYEQDKAVAKDGNSTICMLQMDFAENFTASFQDEIQSAHWRQRQISIFTVMTWARHIIGSSVIISDVKEHDKRAVSTYTYIALEQIKRNMPFVKTVHVWTDGPSSQFKNRYIFSLIGKLEQEFDLKITWNYSATSHGKGPNDGLGGNVKRIVQRKILNRQAVVTNAESFATAVMSATQQIQVTIQTQKNIDDRCLQLDLDTVWSTTPTVPGTINIHHVTTHGTGQINTKFYTSAQGSKIHNIAKRSDTEPEAVAIDEKSPPSESAQGSQIHNIAKRSDTEPEELAVDEESPSSESDDIPLAQLTARNVDYPCAKCGWIFGSSDDPKKEEDWLKCSCDKWFHESCAEDSGIIDDNDLFTCEHCV